MATKGVLKGLKPERVFHYFEEICAIPHPSGQLEEIAAYLENKSRELGLECNVDEYKNVIIKKPAYPGYEDHPAIMLQGHIDMVAVKETGCPKDMSAEGIEPYVDGDLVRARGTSLGGDDGAAVAIILALLEDRELKAPAIEGIFTADEETGLVGATEIDLSQCRAKMMINLDSEEEGILTAGCAGGARVDCLVDIKRTEPAGKIYELTVKGLHGGHSGVEIHMGYANAILLLGRCLGSIADAVNIAVGNISGGVVDNAIPSSAECLISIDGKDAAALEDKVKELNDIIGHEWSGREPGLEISLEEKTGSAEDAFFMDDESAMKVIRLLHAYPQGVIAMNPRIEGLVETSLNMGIMRTLAPESRVMFSFAVRSSGSSAKEYIVERLKMITSLAGGSVNIHGVYPGWEYAESSKIRDVICEAYREQKGEDPKIVTIHAGLECGIFKGKLPELDTVSIGPDVSNVHSPREAMSISSVERTYDLIRRVLEKL